MHRKSILIYIVSTLLCLLMLVSCTAVPTAEPETPTSDAPIDTTPEEPVSLPDYTEEISALLDTQSTETEALTYTKNAKGVTVTGYTGDATVISIPKSIEGLPVVAIGDGAFRDLTALQALVIPESVTSVGKEILAGCKSLLALETPVMGKNGEGDCFLGTLFGAERFEDNPLDIPASLAHLRLTGDMTVLPAYALYDCNDLVTLSLPSSLERLEKFSITKCASLEVIEGLEGLTFVGEHALSYCTSLTKISFGDALEKIEFAALEGSIALREMTLPFVGGTKTENTYLGYVFGARYADFSEGYYPFSLSRVTLLPVCRTLGTNAFYECKSLREVVLPEGLTEIGIRAFYGCDALYTVVLPNSLKTLRENAFLACDGLVSVDFGKGLSSMGINAFMNCDSLERVVLPQSLSVLPASAFSGCSALSEIDLGGVRTVEAEAFRGCTSVETVSAAGSVTFEKGNESVESALEVK